MYKVNEVEEIIGLTDSEISCSISQMSILRYLYHYHKSGDAKKVNVKYMRKFYIRYLKNAKLNEGEEFPDLILTPDDIKLLCS